MFPKASALKAGYINIDIETRQALSNSAIQRRKYH